jgi:DNA-binding MarR family transcriptional regulator
VLRNALLALLEFFDEEPQLARYLIVHSDVVGERVQSRRAEVLCGIAVRLDDERAPARSFPPPLIAQAVASGVLGALQDHLTRGSTGPLTELAGPLMSFIVLPFVGSRAARRELARSAPGAHPKPAAQAIVTVSPLKDAAGRLNPRAAKVLAVIAADPGLNNRGVARRSAVRDEGQISRVLARLETLGLIENISRIERATAKAWQLTTSGRAIEAARAREAARAELPGAFDLPKEFLGHLDDHAISMLRAIGVQPWLRTAEVAERAGIKDARQQARSLKRLVDLGLALSEREPHQRGTPKVWELSPAGKKLNSELERETSAPPRSVAAELMHESGGRLSDTSISALRTLGAEPGLSNNELARRVGVADQNSMSQLLARLRLRGLVENTRIRGRANAWRLTADGEQLERAIWHEIPPSVRRNFTFDLLRDQGGRLNHRVCSVLRVISAEAPMSNQEVAQRASIGSKGHASTLLARIARFGLIENLAVDPAPFESNAWRLTATGRKLQIAIRHGGHDDLRLAARRARPQKETDQ